MSKEQIRRILAMYEAPSKPAIKSVTIWGGVISLLGALVDVVPDIAQVVAPILGAHAGAVVTATGGIIAILGRKFGGTKEIEGLVRQK